MSELFDHDARIMRAPRVKSTLSKADFLLTRVGEAIADRLDDLAKCASGSDRCLAPRDMLRERLARSLGEYQPQIVAFTSKAAWRGWKGLSSRAAVSYGWQEDRLGKTAFYVLPSPSGAARGYWDLGHWRALADEYRRRLRMT